MATTATAHGMPSNPAGRSVADVARTEPPAFPGCKQVHLPRADVERFGGRLEYWEAAIETAWICEPTTSYHERPARLLARLAERVAAVRGSHVQCDGSIACEDEAAFRADILQADLE